MQLKNSIIFLIFVCACFSVQSEICTDGTLLFREDFGGKETEDAEYSSLPIPSMNNRYKFFQNLPGERMSSGSYFVTKKGYNNGGQWHIQDDHTYPNDYERGYFLGIDGDFNSLTFYETEISDLCEGTTLSFSAYVANVITFANYNNLIKRGFPVENPNLLFVISDATNGNELAKIETGEIACDDTKNSHLESSQWNQYGMTFTVPTGVSAVKLSIQNFSKAAIGNDFAIDESKYEFVCRL